MKLIYFHIGFEVDGILFEAGKAYKISDEKGSATFMIRRGFAEISEEQAKEKKCEILLDPRLKKEEKVEEKVEEKKEEVVEEKVTKKKASKKTSKKVSKKVSDKE